MAVLGLSAGLLLAPAPSAALQEAEHWAFRPPADPAPPPVRDARWPRDPLDRFVLARLEEAGLAPAPPADRRTWLRRVTFDLTGLPPSEEELAAFLADGAPGAEERVVERLLASPHYGERQARAWLDVARYADSNGVDENLALAEAWRYRDWVVRAFREDIPYDRFLTMQVAGDLLPAADRQQLLDQRTATGFLVLGPKMLAEQDKEKLVMDVVDEQLDVLGQAFLGLTLGCARCHDHEFDPIPTRDYYALAGIFRSTSTLENLEHVSRWRERDLATDDERAARDEHVARLEAARGARDEVRRRADEALERRWRGELAAYLLAGTEAAESARFLQAEAFARGNLRADDAQWGSPGTVIVHTAAAGLQHVEYDVTLEAPARLRLELRYAAEESRPLRLFAGGALVAEAVAGEPTGGWRPEHQRWSRAAVLELPAGTSVLRLERDGPVPHLDQLLLVPAGPAGSDEPAWPRTADAARHGLPADLDPALVRNFAQLVTEAGPLLALWGPIASLAREDAEDVEDSRDASDEPFAERAAALLAELRGRVARGELEVSPLLGGLLDGLPPTSPREWAARHQAAFAAVEVALAERRRAADAAQPETPVTEPEAALERFLAAASALAPSEREQRYGATARDELARLEAEIGALERALPPPFERVLAVQDEERPVDLPVHVRGSHLSLAGEPVPRGTLRLFDPFVPPPEIPAGASGRLELARWMCHPEHPLTARVLVNRVWQGHFGRGLVASASYFGLRGARPTHPELLDRLARDFVRSGWSVRALHRRIVLSATYRMSSRWDAAAAAADPENRLLWRMDRRRLEAEALRDALLAVAGTLDPTLGGSLLEVENAAYVTNDQSADQARYGAPRRSLYLPVIRNAPYELFAAFDYGDPSVPLATRPSTVVASQALFFLNSPLVLDASRDLAALVTAAEQGEEARLALAWRRVLSRPPDPDELALARAFLAERRAALSAMADLPPAEPGGATAAGARREPPADRGSELLAWQDLCQVLLSSNEFLYLD